MDLNPIEYLNTSVWVRLGNTSHGIGVFAIRDIPSGTRITDYDIPQLDLKSFSVESSYFLNNINKLHPEIKRLINDRNPIPQTGIFHFYPPNCHQMIRMYLNHSQNPNINKNLVSIKNISFQEEVTISYNEMLENNISTETKNHHKYINKSIYESKNAK